MPGVEKMSTRELGLVLAQQLLDVEDLHYGLWDADLALTLTMCPSHSNAIPRCYWTC